MKWPGNKATSYHLGQLKAKLAKLKRELIGPSSGSGGGGGGIGFDVARYDRAKPNEIYLIEI
ncbi:GTP-binding protein rbg1 [Stygiomarasmius scandens]|uniref:GTP-binding protein rbg1 n=1 Tax=Marasmiellus scandens TaxID=2682957 RepID=A0ABR1K353_9AGAR